MSSPSAMHSHQAKDILLVYGCVIARGNLPDLLMLCHDVHISVEGKGLPEAMTGIFPFQKRLA